MVSVVCAVEDEYSHEYSHRLSCPGRQVCPRTSSYKVEFTGIPCNNRYQKHSIDMMIVDNRPTAGHSKENGHLISVSDLGLADEVIGVSSKHPSSVGVVSGQWPWPGWWGHWRVQQASIQCLHGFRSVTLAWLMRSLVCPASIHPVFVWFQVSDLGLADEVIGVSSKHPSSVCMVSGQWPWPGWWGHWCVQQASIQCLYGFRSVTLAWLMRSLVCPASIHPVPIVSSICTRRSINCPVVSLVLVHYSNPVWYFFNENVCIWIKISWSLFLRVQLTIFQHSFR